MLNQLRGGDIVTAWKLDRLDHSTRNLLEIVEAFRQPSARFQSISEPWADTTTHVGKMIMTIFAGIAEFERDLIRERTRCRTRRPVRTAKEDERRVTPVRLNEGKSVSDVARTFSIHPATLYRTLTPVA